MAKTKGKSTSKAADYAMLKAEMRAGRNRDLYVLTGEEDFLIRKLIDSLQALLIAPGCESLDRVRMDVGGQANRFDLNRLKAEIMTPPFMSRKKLIIVRQCGLFASTATGKSSRPVVTPDQGDNESDEADQTSEDSDQTTESSASEGVGAQKSRQAQLQEILARIPDCACVVFVENKVDRRLKALIQLIEEKGVLAEIGHEQPHLLRQWVVAECRQRQLTITTEAAESLVDRCDAGMQVIWLELNKLFLYTAYAQVTAIDLDLIAEISLPDLRGNIFDLTDAISNGQTERALVLLDTLISLRQPVQLIQFMLTRHFRQLICAAEIGRPEEVTGRLKVMPFVANRLVRQARHFSMPVMERIYALCFESDLQVKTGRIADRLVLETLLVRAGEAARTGSRKAAT